MDWDGDGRLDIIVGDREGGISYFRRISEGPLLLAFEPPIEVAGHPIKLPHNSAPSVTDWNGDGLPDMAVGRSEGIPAGLYLFVNQGTPGAPLFLATDTLEAGEEPIQIYYAYPDFHDMDGDGLEDLVVGSSTGMISCFLNSGTAVVPVYEEMVYLQSEGEDINFYNYVRPSVCDWNGDGTPDLLASTGDGLVNLLLGDPETGIGGGIEGPDIEWSTLLENPALDEIGLSVDLAAPTELRSRIYSVGGRLLLERLHGELPAGESILQIDVAGLPAGAVIIETRDVGKFVNLPTEYQLVTINIR